jgi:hypothetical protein
MCSLRERPKSYPADSYRIGHSTSSPRALGCYVPCLSASVMGNPSRRQDYNATRH